MRKSEDLHIQRDVGECLERNDKLAFRKRQSYLQSAFSKKKEELRPVLTERRMFIKDSILGMTA